VVDIDDSRLNVRRGPSTDYVVVDKILPGDVLVVTGRTEDGSWVRIESPELPRGFGWVASPYVELSEPVAKLPVVGPGEDTAEAFVSPSSDADSPSVQTNELTGRLVFQSAPGGTIFVHDLESGVTEEVSSGFDPAISPDGTMVVFTRGEGENGLYTVGIDGNNERRIFSGSELLRAPSWSPDGQWIVFSRASGEYECRDVGFGICLPDNPFLEEFPLSRMPELSLSRVNVDGNDFADLPARTSGQAPNWHEGGIVYQSNSGLEITSSEPDGATRTLISAPYYQDPSWQPGGDRIVFQSREGSHWEILALNSDGSGLTALTRPATTLVDELPSNVAPSWSPDGRQIVYLSNRDDDNDSGTWRIWVMNADGSGARPISLDVPIDYTFASEQVVSWGP
jgi:Tol biopolymer transport system component